MSIPAVETFTPVAVVKTLVLAVGSAITHFAFEAYRRTKRPALGYLAGGFGFVTLGLALAGVLHELLDVSLETGVLFESLLVLAGFLVIAYSLSVS